MPTVLHLSLCLILGACSSLGSSGRSPDAATAGATAGSDDASANPTGPLGASIIVHVDASNQVRKVSPRLFGINTGAWSTRFKYDADNTDLLHEAGITTLRFPGGSLSDEYDWKTSTVTKNGQTSTMPLDFDSFAQRTREAGAQAFITVNYGSGSAQQAAEWVRHANVNKRYGFEYWEIGNECYGKWEYDVRPRPQDPYTYALEAQNYAAAMKAVDPTIRVGVVWAPGKDSDYAFYEDHVATNPRTGARSNGWNPVMLSTLRDAGFIPDFVIFHKYDFGPGAEDDAVLLASTRSWPDQMAEVRSVLDDYLGAASRTVRIVVTEHNSVWEHPGKQSTSLVNALYLMDSLATAARTELDGLVWWLFRSTVDATRNNNPSLYGWREYGAYGVIDANTKEKFPTFYGLKLFKSFARGGDMLVEASSGSPLLAAHAVRATDGSLRALIINKSAVAALDVEVKLSGFSPAPTASVAHYGKAQDDAARTQDGSTDVVVTTRDGISSRFRHRFPPYSATVLELVPQR
jgi:hypothetical protein